MEYKDFKLTIEAENYLRSIAIPKLVRDNRCSVTQAWFETFLEHLDRVGYKIIRIPESK